jgi:hypothetical protein
MEAIEFKTILHNGMVTIPSEYSMKWEGKTIRVIVLDESESLSAPKEKKRIFKAVSLNTQGFKFNRDEANER